MKMLMKIGLMVASLAMIFSPLVNGQGTGCQDLSWCISFTQETCQENDVIRTNCPVSCNACPGSDSAQRSLPTATWTQWSAFSTCSSSCGEGQQQRTRLCLTPTGQLSGNLNNCIDPTGLGPVEFRSCFSAPCVTAAPWTACSKTCGGGQQSRRNCILGDCATAFQDCNTQRCPGPVTAAPWTACSKTCGGGQQSRRNCILGDCATAFRDCNTQRCPGPGKVETEYVARTFFRSITAASSRTWSRRSCPGDFVSSDSSVRMYGSPCPDRQQAPRDRTFIPKSKRDILFVIDESDSIGIGNFRTFVRLARTIVEKSFCGGIGIAADKTRVGAVTFDSRQHLQMDLKTSFNKEEMLSMIQAFNFNFTSSGFTCIGDTLRYAMRDVLGVSGGGRRNDRDTEQVIVLLSDGCSYCKLPNSVSGMRTVAQELRRNGVVVITFLLGEHSGECIEEMKSLIDGSRCYQLFQFNDGIDAEIAINTLEASQCPSAWTRPQC